MIIALVNSKGGVGKSTLAGNLVGWLHEHGKSVVLADADTQQSSTEWILEALPAVRSFVKQDAGEAHGDAPAREHPQPAVRAVPAPEARSGPETRPALESRGLPPRTKKRRMNGVTPVAPIPVTVRLRPDVAGGLKRASLERQLSGEELFTQQDLVENLLEPWLRDQGYIE